MRYVVCLLSFAISIMAYSKPLLSQVLTEFELNVDNSEIKEFSTNFINLGRTNFNNFFNGVTNFETGDNKFDFTTQFFTPNSSGQYFFGQSEAPVDTVMIVYKGEFNPENPSENFFSYNDDFRAQFDGTDWDGTLPDGITVISCSDPEGRPRPELCPIVRADLEAGQAYHIVISTFLPTADLSLPLRFFVFGPDGVLVGEEAAAFAAKLFETVVAGQPQQPSGTYLDTVFANLDPNSRLAMALRNFAALDDGDRQRFVESMGSNVSVAGTSLVRQQIGQATISTVNSRIRTIRNSQGVGFSGGLNTSGFTGGTPSTPATAYAGLRGASSPLEGSDTASLAGLASSMSFQGDVAVGEASLWSEGYFGRGTAPSLSYSFFGGAVGIDRLITEDFLLGGFAGLGHGRADGSDPARARVRSDNVSFGGYTAWYRGPLTISGKATLSLSRNKNRRTIAGLGFETVEGNNDGREISVSGGLNYRFDLTDRWSLSPNWELTHSWNHQSGYTEEGDTPLTLTYSGSRQQIWQSVLGFDTQLNIAENGRFSAAVFAGAGWGHTIQSGGAVRAALSADATGNSFTLQPSSRHQNSLELSSGFSLMRGLHNGRNVSLRAAYEGSFTRDEARHTGRLAVFYRW